LKLTLGNFNIQQEFGKGFIATAGYVGSRSTHLAIAADDINLVPSQEVPGVGIIFPCNPTVGACTKGVTGTRLDPNWGGAEGIRPEVFDGAASYEPFRDS
jgi:hypothetical protein